SFRKDGIEKQKKTSYYCAIIPSTVALSALAQTLNTAHRILMNRRKKLMQELKKKPKLKMLSTSLTLKK
ncbi:MAG: hypothetical protein ACI9NY_002429, partial [Kiritimatiellia bacterium]